MDRTIVENILEVVKTSTDKKVIIKGLLKLRTDLVKDRDGIVLFREAGGVAPMVRFLNKPHESILEVALSILGNCCTDDMSCKEALECKVSVALVTILKSIPNPVIQCRACRLLGNLAKSDCMRLLLTHCQVVAHSVCQIIEDTNDVQTRVMAFRACRFMLVHPLFTKNFLIANGFVILLRILSAVMKNENQEELLRDLRPMPLLGLKQNLHREKYFEEVARNLEGVRSDIFDREVLKNSSTMSQKFVMPKERSALDLLCEILKCMLTMSELQISYSVWEAINRNNCSFRPIVYFASKDNKNRSASLKILSNFSKNAGAFDALSTADAIVAACELLVCENMDKPLSESERRHCIILICTLSTDACNRSKIRRSGAISKLIDVVKDSRPNTDTALILYLLNNFQYDNISMDLMLRQGLIPVLINELERYLTSNDDYYKKKREEKKHASKKRKITEHPSESSLCKFAKVRGEPIPDYDSPSSSPRSYATPSSPCSSRSMSPFGNNLLKSSNGDGVSDSETYSPVCSDDEGDDDEAISESVLIDSTDAQPPRTESDHSDVMKLLDIACRSEPVEENMLDREDDDELSEDVPNIKLPHLGNSPRSTIDIIDSLLFRITLLVNKRGELGKPETLHTLIKAINIFGTNNNFCGSLTNILLESQFFAQVIKQGIVHQIYGMTKIEETRNDALGLLETLTCVGESNYGKAELARLLRCDDEHSQKRAAIGVAYVIKSHRLLYHFLNDGNALNVLLNIILSSKCDEFVAEAVDALTSMSKQTLGITMPHTHDTKYEDNYDEFNENEHMQNMHVESNMHFIVHEMNSEVTVSVGFNKQLLCQSSEVFSAMLNSNFREGNDGKIHLKTYTVSGLKYFLNLIIRESQQLKANVPPACKFHALLEAFEISRVYIIPSMEKRVLQLLIGMLDESNCQRVLEWSVRNYHTELTEMAINFYLCSMLSTDVKVKLFRSAEYSTYSTEWLQMIFDAVLTSCRSGF